MSISSRGTTSAGRRGRIKVDEVFDVIDLEALGLEITFNDYTKLHLPPSEAQAVLADLKDQLRAKKDPEERSAHWEGYNYESGVYENAPHLVVPVYSFRKEMAIRKSRLTREEREALDG